MPVVVRIDAGGDAVRAFVKGQAALGKDHVVSLVKTEAAALADGIADFSEEQGKIAAPGAFSALQVLQHLNGSFARSMDRMKSLSQGQSWAPAAGTPPAGGGYIPPEAETSFTKARQDFIDQSAAVVAFLEGVDASKAGSTTAPHAVAGDFNWLEWAVYSHYVHTHDHTGQIGEIRGYVRHYALPSGQLKLR